MRTPAICFFGLLLAVGCRPVTPSKEHPREANHAANITIAQVFEQIERGSKEERRAVALQLKTVVPHAQKPPSAELIGKLLRAFGSDDPVIRLRVLQALTWHLPSGCDPPIGVIPAITTAMRDSSGDVQFEAFNTLAKIEKDRETLLDVILVAAKDKDPRVRMQAAIELHWHEKNSEKTIPALRDALGDTDHRVRQEAICSLVPYGQRALALEPQLIDALRDPNDLVRWEAARVLGVIEADPKKVGPALLAAFKKESNARAQRMFAERLGHYPVVSRESVPLLIQRLDEDGNEDVREACATGLGTLRKEPKQSVPALLKAAKDPSSPVRNQAIMSLGRFGKEARDGVPVIIAALHDQKTRSMAALVLAQFGPDASDAVPELIKMLKEEPPNPEHAVQALGAIGPAAKAALPHIREIQKNRSMNMFVVEGALRRIDPGSVP